MAGTIFGWLYFWLVWSSAAFCILWCWSWISCLYLFIVNHFAFAKMEWQGWNSTWNINLWCLQRKSLRQNAGVASRRRKAEEQTQTTLIFSCDKFMEDSCSNSLCLKWTELMEGGKDGLVAQWQSTHFACGRSPVQFLAPPCSSEKNLLSSPWEPLTTSS